MPGEQKISEMIQENVVKDRAPRASESLPSGNPARPSSHQLPNLPVAPGPIPPSEHPQQTSSRVQSSAVDVSLVVRSQHLGIASGGLLKTCFTWLENKLFVAAGCTISVFDDGERSIKFEKSVMIKRFGEPWCMTASAVSRSVFVCGDNKACIWKIQLPGMEVKAMNIFDRKADDLSITQDGELLAAVRPTLRNLQQESAVCQLIIFKQKNGGRKIVQLPGDIGRVPCAAQLPDLNFVITYSIFLSDKYLIGIISSDGENMIRKIDPRSFDPLGSKPNESGELEHPYYFTIVDNEQIFAADCSRPRILLLNSDFTSSGRRLPTFSHAASTFKRIDYIHAKQQLLIQGTREISPNVSGPLFARFYLNLPGRGTANQRETKDKKIPNLASNP